MIPILFPLQVEGVKILGHTIHRR